MAAWSTGIGAILASLGIISELFTKNNVISWGRAVATVTNTEDDYVQNLVVYMGLLWKMDTCPARYGGGDEGSMLFWDSKCEMYPKGFIAQCSAAGFFTFILVSLSSLVYGVATCYFVYERNLRGSIAIVIPAILITIATPVWYSYCYLPLIQEQTFGPYVYVPKPHSNHVGVAGFFVVSSIVSAIVAPMMLCGTRVVVSNDIEDGEAERRGRGSRQAAFFGKKDKKEMEVILRKCLPAAWAGMEDPTAPTGTSAAATHQAVRTDEFESDNDEGEQEDVGGLMPAGNDGQASHMCSSEEAVELSALGQNSAISRDV